jgi:hypothetical protein
MPQNSHDHVWGPPNRKQDRPLAVASHIHGGSGTHAAGIGPAADDLVEGAIRPIAICVVDEGFLRASSQFPAKGRSRFLAA